MEQLSVPFIQSSLIGREHERSSLWQHFISAAKGRLSVVLISGEAGIGKTRLLDELVLQVDQEGGQVLRGGATEAEGMPPYLPFLEGLGRYITSASLAQLHEQIGSHASVLATILPELVPLLKNLPESYPLPPEQARLRLYEAVGTFLAAIADTRPLLLILDDLHWADSATLDLLCYVARHQAKARLLIIGAYRPGEITQRVTFERMQTELNRMRLLSTLTPGPLSSTDLHLLASAFLRAPIDPTLSTLLATQSEGNPFFAEELLRGWLEANYLTQEGEGLTLVAPREASLPSSIVHAVHVRLSRLSPAVIALLRIAATIGRAFQITLLSKVAQQEEEAVEEALQEAVRAHLIHNNQAGGFTFHHDLIREYLYDEMSATKRRRFHTLIGHQLQLQFNETTTTRTAQQLAELAFHFVRSGEREQGALYSQQAAELALKTYAPQEAMAHYHRTLFLLQADKLQRGLCLLGLGKAALLAGSFQEAIETFHSAYEWWKAHNNQDEAGRAALELGRAYWRREEIGPARIALEQALALLSDLVKGERLSALIELGSLLVLSIHEYKKARDYLEEALTLAQQCNDSHLEIAARRALGVLFLRTGDLPNAILLLEQALTQAEYTNDVLEATEICASLSLGYRWTGAFDRQQEVLQRWLFSARRCHDPYQLRHLYSFLAVGYALRGQRAEAEEALRQSQRIVELLDSPEPLAMLQLTQGSLLGLWGELEKAEELTQSAISRFRELEPRSLVWWLGNLGFIQALAGKETEALAILDELNALIAPLPEDASPTVHTLCLMGAITYQLSNRNWAARLYPRLVPFSGQMHTFPIDRLLGSLALLLKDFPAAQKYLLQAEEMTRRCDLKAELAPTLLAQADLAIARHGRSALASANIFLDEAQVLARQVGMRLFEHELQQKRSQLTKKEGQAPPPAGLSQREMEVVRLVAQGKSNREIAEVLIISERTVANHVANICNKIGAENRASAAAFAIRHHIAN